MIPFQPVLKAIFVCFRKEMELFKLLRELHGDEDSTTMPWQPFKGKSPTEVLKATTIDIAGVAMTIMNLRTVAESYADLNPNPSIQTGLSLAEGHTERTAKGYYKRNGTMTIMRSWADHIEKLIHGQKIPDDEDEDELGEVIDMRMEESQQRWRENLEKYIGQFKGGIPVFKRKAREDWSKEEDAELIRLVRKSGTNSWKEILDSSRILQKRYKASSSGT